MENPYGSCVSQKTIIEIEKLKFDTYFLLALALKRTGEIIELFEFFDKDYIINE